jgi:putative protease
MADTLVGKITHYFDKIGVAVVEVLAPIKIGDQIKISGHGNEFTQEVTSMQIEHQQVQEVQKGQTVGMKVDQPVKEGDEVYKVE